MKPRYEWQKHISEGCLLRLAECRSTKRDIPEMAKAYKKYSEKGKNMSAVDCVVYMLEWVLDWNSGEWDYSQDEFDRWTSEVEAV